LWTRQELIAYDVAAMNLECGFRHITLTISLAVIIAGLALTGYVIQ